MSKTSAKGAAANTSKFEATDETYNLLIEDSSKIFECYGLTGALLAFIALQVYYNDNDNDEEYETLYHLERMFAGFGFAGSFFCAIIGCIFSGYLTGINRREIVQLMETQFLAGYTWNCFITMYMKVNFVLGFFCLVPSALIDLYIAGGYWYVSYVHLAIMILGLIAVWVNTERLFNSGKCCDVEYNVLK